MSRRKSLQESLEATHPVRIVNLLEHTAGFDDMEPSEVYNVQIATIFLFSTYSSDLGTPVGRCLRNTHVVFESRNAIAAI